MSAADHIVELERWRRSRATARRWLLYWIGRAAAERGIANYLTARELTKIIEWAICFDERDRRVRHLEGLPPP